MNTPTFPFWTNVPHRTMPLGNEDFRLLARGENVHIYIRTPKHENDTRRAKKLPAKTPRSRKQAV